MGFIFNKCRRQRTVPIVKAKGDKAATLRRLRSFLDTQEPQAVRWLVSMWQNQQASITYREIRKAILRGEMSEAQLTKWQNDYSELVNTKLAEQWSQAMAAAVAEKHLQFPHYVYDPSVDAARAYVQRHGAELVTKLISTQRDALQSMIAQAVYYDGITIDNLSLIMRPVIGLTTPQTLANLNYYNAVRDGLLKNNPNMKLSTAEKRARESAARYAARQHRHRAQTIARTELAEAYNQGAYSATLDARERGFIGDCRKTWLTAADEMVCPECGGMDGESANMDSLFSIGVLLPPAHPNCRCGVAYEEISEPVTPAILTSN